MDMISGASQLPSNPFVVLTFIVAPAILTNASALMVLSTSNRFARAIDRARDLSRQIETARRDGQSSLLERLCNELTLTERRAILLLSAIRCLYTSLGGFAFGALLALIGASLAGMNSELVNRLFAVASVAAAVIAVGGLVIGSMFLFQESRVTVRIIQDRISGLTPHEWQ